jgi:hypothetical protein
MTIMNFFHKVFVLTEVGEVNDFKFETQPYKREQIETKMAGLPAIFL